MRLLLLLLALGLGGTAGALLLIASRGRRYLAQLASVPESSCAELTDESAAVARQLGATALRKRVELNGTGRPSGSVVLAPFSGRPVLWYEATVTHHYWQRTSSVDGQGRRSTSRRKRSEVVSREVGNTVPLRLDDGTGSVEVDLRGARIDSPALLHEQLQRGSDRAPVLRLGPLSFRGRTDTIGYTYRERALVEGDQLYVCGTALSRAGTGLTLAGAPGAELLVSTRTEQQPRASGLRRQQWTAVLAVLAALGAVALVVLALVAG